MTKLAYLRTNSGLQFKILKIQNFSQFSGSLRTVHNRKKLFQVRIRSSQSTQNTHSGMVLIMTEACNILSSQKGAVCQQ